VEDYDKLEKWEAEYGYADVAKIELINFGLPVQFRFKYFQVFPISTAAFYYVFSSLWYVP